MSNARRPWEDVDEDGLKSLLKCEAPNASCSSLSLWVARLLWAAHGERTDQEAWKQAKTALPKLRQHLEAAQAAEASLPSSLRHEVEYCLPIATMSDILARAVKDLEGKISLAEGIVAAHFERTPVRRGNPTFAYSDAQLEVGRLAGLFWQQAVGKTPTPGRDSEGLPTSEFGRFLARILDKLNLDGNAALLAEKVVMFIRG